MKIMKPIFAATLLTLSLLAGCASNSSTQEAESTSVPITEAIVATLNTTVPVTTTEETAAPTETSAPFVVEITPVITEPQKQVTVKTADEFLAAIAPNTEIIVDTELIDLSKATGYGETDGEYYYWNESHDGPELYISGVSNLTIRGSGEEHNANVISSVPRYSVVLTFQNCSNILIKGLTAGHTEEPGSCTGGVLCFENSQDILVEDCGLFGCGTLGVIGFSSKNMQIVNNDIYDCSVGGVELNNCDDVNVDGNTFRDLGGSVFRIYGCGAVTCNGEPVHDFSPRP